MEEVVSEYHFSHSLLLNWVVVGLLFGSEPYPSQSPREDAAHFVQDFRAEYGDHYPDFMICSYEEVSPLMREAPLIWYLIVL